MTESCFRIVFPLYEGVTQLDFTGPHQFFCRLPGVEVLTASLGGKPITTDGLTFADLTPLEDIQACDLVCVPGGFGCTDAMNDEAYMAALRRLAASARYITSVCTGSLILGAAGLLKGKRAACHWAWRDLLPLFGAIADDGRVVRDGNIITGGGVTAGIDFALVVAAELAGENVARALQLGLEYAPAPPFDSGRPETASPDLVASHRKRMAGMADMRRAGAEQAAAKLVAA
jgi:cyclohexyl-isocyanide hydratase